MRFITSTDGMSWLLACSLKAAILFAASWIGAALLRRSTAAARHQIWTLGVLGALVLPILCWVVPSLLPASSTPAPHGTASLVVPAMDVTPASSAGDTSMWPTWLAIAWTIGALLVGIRIVRSHLAARRLVRGARPLDESVVGAAARHVAILRSETIHSPMTIGVLRPCVLLPVAADSWSRERLRAVLMHELGHVQRRDTLVQLAAQVASALYWWNPLAWLAVSRLRIEREHACDDLVLAAGTRPTSYASDLVDVARSISVPAQTSAIGMVDRSSVEARLHRILDANMPRRMRLRTRIGALALACSLVATIACTSSAPPSLPPDPGADSSQGTVSVGKLFLNQPGVLDEPGLDLMATHGQVDLSLVSAEVRRRSSSLAHCYERRLASNPALAGTITIHWVIDTSGNVPEACITSDTVRDRELVDCVNELVLHGGPFPAPTGGFVDVSMPFSFGPGAPVAQL